MYSRHETYLKLKSIFNYAQTRGMYVVNIWNILCCFHFVYQGGEALSITTAFLVYDANKDPNDEHLGSSWPRFAYL